MAASFSVRVCVACYLPAQRRHFNVLLHLAIPLVGALALIPVLLAASGINVAHLSITGLTYPIDPAAYLPGLDSARPGAS